MRFRLAIYFIASLALLAFYAPTHAFLSVFAKFRDSLVPQ